MSCLVSGSAQTSSLRMICASLQSLKIYDAVSVLAPPPKKSLSSSWRPSERLPVLRARRLLAADWICQISLAAVSWGGPPDGVAVADFGTLSLAWLTDSSHESEQPVLAWTTASCMTEVPSSPRILACTSLSSQAAFLAVSSSCPPSLAFCTKRSCAASSSCLAAGCRRFKSCLRCSRTLSALLAKKGRGFLLLFGGGGERRG